MAGVAGSYSESAPVLKDRLKRAGFNDSEVEKISSQVRNLKQLAFVSSYAPGQSDEAPLMQALKDALADGVDLTLSQKASWRVAYNEAFAIVTAEMKQAVERTEEPSVRHLSQPERSERHEQQAKRLVGVSIKGSSEPSEQLVDLCVGIYERNQLAYVPWSKCSSREQEVQAESRKDVKLSFESGTSKLKLEPAPKELHVDTSSEVLLMQALQRRALALEQANVVDFLLIDSWHQKMMKCRLTDAPPGYVKPTFEQLKLADQKLFSELQDGTRSGIQANASGRPVDAIFKEVMSRPEVTCLMQPLPSASSSSSARIVADGTRTWDGSKGSAKGKGKGKRKGSGFGPAMPAELIGCNSTTRQGKPLCYDFNMERGCSRPVKNNACEKGLHFCAWPRCGQAHSASKCPKRAQAGKAE